MTEDVRIEESEMPDPLPQQEEFYRPPARFGAIPMEAEPLGWDNQKGFKKHYPRVDLPTQIVERVSLGMEEEHEPNRLIWGDNLHIMRQLQSNSIDLIYIDPPFFSGRQYNMLWGDANEMRSFNDIWEGGMIGYLIWLNARLYEMKRLLKRNGSIYVHCDWHASHYIKVEMDKIFGHEHFRNAIVWKRKQEKHNLARRFAPNAHDTILWFARTAETKYNIQYEPYEEEYLKEHYKYEDERGRYATFPCTNDAGGNRVYEFRGIARAWRFKPDKMEELWAAGMLTQAKPDSPFRYKKYYDPDVGVKVDDLWLDFPAPRGKDVIGYPTQKPESLLERIIKASSAEAGTVADFFVGGGTTALVAQRLGRQFIGCDQSRVAIAVTAERLKQQAVKRGMGDVPVRDFTVEQWGIYEATQLSSMPMQQFRSFVLQAYGATRLREEEESAIAGWRNQLPIWVGASALDAQASSQDVQDFANAIRRTVEYRDANLRDGVMLSWGFSQGAQEAATELRRREDIDVNFVRLKQIRIGDAEFREHIVGRSTAKADYSEFLTFVQPPVVSVAYRALGGNSVTLDAGDSVVLNAGAEIINVQWDFDYDWKGFKATEGYSFQRDKKPLIKVTHKFSRAGSFSVACRVQDSKGGEGMWNGTVKVK